MELAISVPAYNEVDTLARVVSAALDQIETSGIDGIVYIVDDGSTDGTSGLADELARQEPRVRVQHHSTNLGFSGAIRSALTGPRTDFVFLIAADGQIPVDILPGFWALRHDADVVVGVRRPRADPPLRRFFSCGYHALSRILLGITVTEFTSTLLVRRETLELATASRPHSAAFLAEFVARAQRRGARFREVGYRHLPRMAGRPKGADLRVIAETFIELVRIAWLVRTDDRIRAPRPAPAALTPDD